MTENITQQDIIAHVVAQAEKAAAYDALVAELSAVADHLQAMHVSYANSLDSVRPEHREFVLGKVQAYSVAADKVRSALIPHE
ncbi:hypothetical protein M045_gp84 [Mycobacterium phage HINdeR]|uniref:Uncharacterized protein n=1 Tax=Mycobacterium phage HINdeR TaxID=1327770 RepID=R4JF00_9CAUD|nr:hypothetical protein M045_gp84 [Mycobacterium phage HINdeR]AGK87563.1 hypothetical protein PBI_HINDER_84 [Mycobacterium phage HINdeR]